MDIPVLPLPALETGPEPVADVRMATIPGIRAGVALTPLALTMGDPAGIGAEIALGAWRSGQVRHPFFLLDDPTRLAGIARIQGGAVAEIAVPAEAAAVWRRALPVLAHGLAAPVTPGLPDPANAPAVVAAIDRAVALVRGGAASAVVTNPINKAALYEGAGFAFPGHTEYLAHLGGDVPVAMLLAAPGLRVVPVTIHIALSAVPGALTHDLIVATARLTRAALRRDFGIARPRLAMSGLNPHAGEGGAMGAEEVHLIAPAIRQLQAEGIDITGPHPADTMFHPAARARYDVALTMYHDQGLIPLKTLDFARGVNVTLGLPFIRTSPDHGTAYDIAGLGQADPTSLIEALNLAADLAMRRSQA